ncbi:hypothetical protein [Streptomyces sp. OV198]|uniref:hypothetical protein n=1 Tax=Streptomyces sp. OV198 TaxID=1882787 RepID=UPI0027B94A58|nr:hypothetical protein [Streptomyces sp. OV198]
MPYRSNIPKLAEFTLPRLDPDYPRRAADLGDHGGHLIVAGENWGQGSSREHAAITLRYLGLRAVLAQSYARIHWQNLANFGVLPLEFDDPADHDRIQPGDRLSLDGLHAAFAPKPHRLSPPATPATRPTACTTTSHPGSGKPYSLAAPSPPSPRATCMPAHERSREGAQTCHTAQTPSRH